MLLNEPTELYGKEVRTSDDEKLGKIDEILVDDETERIEWAAVKTGLLGRKVALVPLANADRDGDRVTVPYEKDFINAEPRYEIGDGLKVSEEEALFGYFGLPYAGPTATATGTGPVPDGAG